MGVCVGGLLGKTPELSEKGFPGSAISENRKKLVRVKL